MANQDQSKTTNPAQQSGKTQSDQKSAPQNQQGANKTPDANRTGSQTGTTGSQANKPAPRS